MPLASRVAACRALGDRLASLDGEELADLVVGTRLESGWGAAHQLHGIYRAEPPARRAAIAAALGINEATVAATRRYWTARVTFDDARMERLLRGSGYLDG